MVTPRLLLTLRPQGVSSRRLGLRLRSGSLDSCGGGLVGSLLEVVEIQMILVWSSGSTRLLFLYLILILVSHFVTREEEA